MIQKIFPGIGGKSSIFTCNCNCVCDATNARAADIGEDNLCEDLDPTPFPW